MGESGIFGPVQIGIQDSGWMRQLRTVLDYAALREKQDLVKADDRPAERGGWRSIHVSRRSCALSPEPVRHDKQGRRAEVLSDALRDKVIGVKIYAACGFICKLQRAPLPSAACH